MVRIIHDFLTADFDVQAVQILDATGRLLYSKKLSTGESERLEVDLSDEKAGIYMVVVQTSQGKVVKIVSLL